MELLSKKYKEIFKLKQMLKDAHIPYEFYELPGIEEMRKIMPDYYEHWHLNYPDREHCIISVIEGLGTYGEEADKLEIMGGLTDKEAEHDAVIGWLTAEEVFDRIKKLEEKRKGELSIMKKVVRYVDEETLEIKEIITEEIASITDDEIFGPETLAKAKEDATEVADLVLQALDCDPEDFSEKYKKMKQAEKEFEDIYLPFKDRWIELHETHPGIPKSIVFNSGVKVTYVSPTTRTSIDTRKLKEEEPTLAKKYTKTTSVKATTRIESPTVSKI